jgi:hypothetical protein
MAVVIILKIGLYCTAKLNKSRCAFSIQYLICKEVVKSIILQHIRICLCLYCIISNIKLLTVILKDIKFNIKVIILTAVFVVYHNQLYKGNNIFSRTVR